MSAVYIESDKLVLELGARLSDQVAGGDTAVLAELRHVRAELGLSPLSRQRLRWQLDEQAERAAPAKRPRRDTRLQVVQ
jgi:hypothetical protein